MFAIEAHTKIGAGPAKKIQRKMPIHAPPDPPKDAIPEEVSKTSTTINIRFRSTYFSDRNGVVKKYTVIVAEDKDFQTNPEPEQPRSWAEVQSYSRWPAYMAVEPFNPFTKGSQHVDFEIGSNKSCSVDQKGYCNGPLRAGRTYFIKIRAFTDDDKFSETLFKTMTTDTDSAWIVLALSIPFALILVFVVCFISIKRYLDKHKPSNPFDRKPEPVSLSESLMDTNRPVKLKDFGEHYRQMSADSDFRFSEEFEELKRVGREQLCGAADLPVNRPKNRFTNILPYDHSRFKLQPTDDDEGSDYINANYVTVRFVYPSQFFTIIQLICIAGLQFSQRIHRHSGAFTIYSRRFLADVLGVKLTGYCNADAVC